MKSIFSLVTVRPNTQRPSESAVAQSVCTSKLASVSSSVVLPSQTKAGMLPVVWSAPWAVTIIEMPVTSITRGS